MAYFSKDNLLCRNHYSFGKGTKLPLVSMTDEIVKTSNDIMAVAAAICNISKSFDCVVEIT